MIFLDLIKIFFNHVASALVWFVAIVIAAEVIFPGFAAPFLNLPLLALISLGAVFATTSTPSEAPSLFRRILFLIPIFLLGFIALLYLLTLRSPLGTIGKIECISIAILAITVLIVLARKPQTYD